MKLSAPAKIVESLLSSSRASKAATSLLDQGFFSGAMFVLNIMLARWTSAEEYGVFAVLFAIFLILAGIHNALIVDPMTIYGSQKSGVHATRYLSRVYVLHFLVAGGVGLAALVVAFQLDDEAFSHARWALPIAAPIILTFWTTRRWFYVIGKPRSALGMSSSYALVMTAALVILQSTNRLSSYSALLLLAACALLVSIVPVVRGVAGLRFQAMAAINSTVIQHWKYGRWALGESIVFALGTSVYPLLIAYFGGAANAGAFRALQIVFLPLSQVLISCGLLLLPWLARSRISSSDEVFSKHAWTVTGIFIGAAILYVLPVLAWAETIVRLLYDSPDYLRMLWLIPYLGLVALLAAISAALMLILKAAERPDLVFVSTAATCAVTLTVGTALVAYLDMAGIAIALVISTMTGTFLLAWNGLRYIHTARSGQHGQTIRDNANA